MIYSIEEIPVIEAFFWKLCPARYMKEVKTAKEGFEKEANKIPGLESRIQKLEKELGKFVIFCETEHINLVVE